MSPSDKVANWEIFLWALYILGASTNFVDIEDVAIQCYSLAPARFGWRTRPDLPDYKRLYKALQEAEMRRPLLLVKTGDAFGRQITAEGQKWIEANLQRLSRVLNPGAHVPEPKVRPSSRMLAEIESTEAFTNWKDTGAIPHEKWRMAEVLRCSPDSSTATWTDRLESAKATAHAADRKPIIQFLEAVATIHPEWFGGSKHES